jgi:O-acetyl-ADP-ribose deacetylase
MLPPRVAALPDHAITPIAFAAISTGVYRFPPGRAARIAVASSLEPLADVMQPTRVIFCCFSDDTARLNFQAMAQATPLV